MRLALIADIHGNLVALEAVLADCAAHHITEVICLGDVVESGPQPRHVIDCLLSERIPTLLGNTDERILFPRPFVPPTEAVQRAAEIEAWCVGQLRPGDRAFLASLPATLSRSMPDGSELLCFHGTPHSNTELLRATTPEHELTHMLQGTSAALLAGGHTHVQMLRRTGEQLIINPGSVGMPYETRGMASRRPPWAEYALLIDEGKGVQVSFRRVPLHVDAVVAAAYDAGMPEADWWAAPWHGWV